MSYDRRVGRVVEHIRGNLEADLSLEALARIAHFSPYHFHRIFKAVTGETIAAFTRRARLERAVYLMRASPERELSSIALEVGFNTPSDFSRVFRRSFGMAPSAWDRESRLDGGADYAVEARRAGAEPPAAPQIASHAAVRVAYLTVRDPWSGDNLNAGYLDLIDRLERREIDWRQSRLFGSSWDSEKSTPIDQLTYDLGFAVGADFEADDALGVRDLPAVEAVEIHCANLPEVALAWDHLYTAWLPASDYEPADVPALKRFCQVPADLELGGDGWLLDCSIALRPQQP